MARIQSKRLKPLSLPKFNDQFPTDEHCAQFLFEKRWPDGWKCPRCGHDKAYRLARRGLYQCASCDRQSSVTAGTVLHGTRTSLRLWFLAMFLMVTDKRGISSVALGKFLDISQSKAWTMLHKLRSAMALREGCYQLNGLVDLSECFFGAPKEGGGRGCEADKAKMLVGLSLSGDGSPKHLRMLVLPGLDRIQIEKAIRAMVAPGSVVRTDGLRTFRSLPGMGFTHQCEPANEKPNSSPQWLQIAISNARALIAGTYHGVSRKHLPAYTAEYSYRYCRRNRPDLIFARMVTAAAVSRIRTYAEIIDKAPQERSKLTSACFWPS